MADRTRFTYRSDCGCTISGQLNAAGELVNCGGILRCPLHEAAPALVAACEAALGRTANNVPYIESRFVTDQLRAALALARPTPTEKGR